MRTRPRRSIRGTQALSAVQPSMAITLMRRSCAKLRSREAAAFGSSSQATRRSCARRKARTSAGEPARGIQGGDRVQIGSEQGAPSPFDAGAKEPPDAVAPFAAARGFGAGEIIETRSGMGIDRPKRRRLAAEMDKQARQHRMLDDVGEISSVKGMTVVHGVA